MKTVRTVFRQEDPRTAPTYTLSEAAHYLLIPLTTLRSWVVGRYYPVHAGTRFFQPVIVAAQRQPAMMLSFVNLVEAHLLDAIRRDYRIPLPKVRAAMTFLRRKFGSEHPLAEQRMETDGRNLFVRHLGQLISASQDGQLAMAKIIEAYLRRIERDEHGFALRLYPFTRKRQLNHQPKVIVIDPRISFGRPILAGTGIRTEIIAQRYKAGESIDELAQDYGRERLQIEEAIRCELALEAA